MGGKSEKEREIKFDGVEHEKLRERLLEMDAERAGPATFEDNWVLDRGNDLNSNGCVLRLRVDARGAFLTFKGPAHFEGRTKVRVEHETRVDDSEAARSLLEALGFRVVRRYQKMREEWHLGGVTVALDHTPIGDFAEFEGDGAETVARRCGFDLEKSERRTYLRLYEDYLKSHPDAPPDMLFREE
ncbi:MAG TPA: class IV adenylate cyclase [Thermoanaerobaculia bacterium]|nr:class IV adenylate cyclase [Thermoanaerobaculia bacterium]